MVTILKKNSSIDKLKEILNNSSRKRKGVNTFKYLGVLDSNMDALTIQKKMRDEWE